MRHGRRLRWAFGAAAGAAGVFVILAACGPGDIADLTNGRREAGADAPVEPGPVCVLAGPRPKPTAEPSGSSIAPLLFAFDDIRLDTSDYDAGIPKPAGFDLDKTCGCIEAPSCTPLTGPADAGPCDDDAGRDNAGGAMIARIGSLIENVSADYVGQRIKNGDYTILVSLVGWNGTPDDAKVTVSVRASTFGIEPLPDGGSPKPRFDGNDVWSVDPSSIIDGDGKGPETDCQRGGECLAAASDDDAYVSDGHIVAHFERIPFAIDIGAGLREFPLRDVVLDAEITERDGGYRVLGELAGRIDTSKLLSFAGSMREANKPSICRQQEAYKALKTFICSAADLAPPGQDRTRTSCSYMSQAMRFSATPARVGRVRRLQEPPSDCPGFYDDCFAEGGGTFDAGDGG